MEQQSPSNPRNNPPPHVGGYVWDSEVPAPNDLAAWKKAELRLSERMAHRLRTDMGLSSPRAVARYFGRDDLPHFFKEHAQQGVIMAYTAWAILDYRPNRDSKTRAERMLAEGLPPAEAMLLRGRMESHPSLFRVAAHDAQAGTVTLEDVLLGGCVVVHDRLMSQNIDDGLFVAARPFPAGGFHFFELAGPPLTSAMGAEAVDYLRECGLRFTPQHLRYAAHAFGWLWDWMEQWQANWREPRLCNTDGDDLLWHTATFAMADPQSVRSVLRERNDIAYDEERDEYVWWRYAEDKDTVAGETITLGRIQLLNDELILTVNSARRFATAREWLEAMPGVAFRSVTTQSLDELRKNRPRDESAAKPQPVEMTPELTRGLQESITKMYFKWLDNPLPALGGRTPRQACSTEAGRQQVAALIRAIPDPAGLAPIRVPRQAMLRALGLADQSSPSTLPSGLSLPRASAVAPTGRKVGRNEPCPCGSGRKYKKCCGR